MHQFIENYDHLIQTKNAIKHHNILFFRLVHDSIPIEVVDMTYREMYVHLYARMADALEYFYRGDVIMGIYVLEQAHRETEEMAMQTDIIADES